MNVLDDYIKGFNKYAVFNGVSNKQEFLNFVLPNLGISIIASLLGRFEIFFNVFGLLFILIVFFPTIAISVRRLHDAGKSGLYILIPIYNIILLFRHSQLSDNNKFITKQLPFDNTFVSVKIPIWLKILNFINLIPILAWPLSLFVLAFCDNPPNMLYVVGLVLIIFYYPMILIGSLILSFKLYKMQKKLLSIAIPLIVLICILGFITYILLINKYI